MKLVISGYYGFGNIGDEAILKGAIQGLQLIDRSLDITILSRDPEHTRQQYGVSAIFRNSPFQVLRAISGCDIFISGGGALFQDATSRRGILYYLVLIQIALLFRKRVVVFAQGFGPIQSSILKSYTVRVLRKVQLILVRDPEAARRMTESGVVGPPVHVTGDPASILEPPSPEEVKHILEREGILHGGPLIAICPRRPARPPSAERMKQIRRVIAQVGDYFIQKHGAKIIFINFQPRTDVEEATQILNAMSCPADVILREYQPHELMGLLGEMSVVVGIRLHSLIFATLVGTPFVGLSYDPKVASFAKLVGQRFFDLEHMQAEELIGVIEGILANAPQIRSQLLVHREKLRQGAQMNFDLLKEFIYSPRTR